MYYSIFKTLQNVQNIKLVITRQSYRDAWTPVAEGPILKTFESYCTVEAVRLLWWVSWYQHLNKNKQKKLTGKPKVRISRPLKRWLYTSDYRSLVRQIL